MSFGSAIQSFFSNYVNFSGRARRSEYWFSFLFVFLLGIVAGIIDVIVFGIDSDGVSPITVLLYLATFIPMLAVSVRRLHDTGKFGWFLLVGLIPIVGPIMLIVVFASDSSISSNEWGVSPKL